MNKPRIRWRPRRVVDFALFLAGTDVALDRALAIWHVGQCPVPFVVAEVSTDYFVEKLRLDRGFRLLIQFIQRVGGISHDGTETGIRAGFQPESIVIERRASANCDAAILIAAQLPAGCGA